MTPEELYQKYKGRRAVRVRLHDDMRDGSEGVVVGYCTSHPCFPLIIAVTKEEQRGWHSIREFYDHVILHKNNTYGYRYVNESMVINSFKFGR